MPPTPTVSVIMPCYNAAAFLTHSVGSVQAQTFPDWELIIADDLSQDNSLDLARSMAAQDPRIRVLEAEANGGSAHARNRAQAAAKGRYIAFLDADDVWRPEKLGRQIASMQARGAALSYTGYMRHYQNGDPHEVHVPETVDYGTLLKGNVIGCSTAIYDREALGLVEMPNVPLSHDLALWLVILRRVPQAHGICEPLTDYTVHDDSLSANKIKSVLASWRVLHELEGINPVKAGWLMAHSVARRLKRG